MSDRNWQGIRPGAQILDVYNESQLVYLFDEANLQTLKDSGADVQLGFAENEAEVDKQLRRLALVAPTLATEPMSSSPQTGKTTAVDADFSAP